ncbi:hypothetical protein B0H19DRAFT_1368713 [Mycena capillaripes]|nr:hypothetical protein B0H19DRAFT_1368713 [Mycena capillaripes]
MPHVIEAIAREVEDIPSLKALLHESPHVAAYITALYICPPTATTASSEMESFFKILDQLRVLVHIGHRGTHHWNEVTAQVSSVVLDFLARQSLRELYVIGIKDISISFLLTTIPKINFWFVSCLEGPDDLPATTPPTPILTSLRLGFRSNSILELLARPQYPFHTQTLRQLDITVKDDEYVYTHALLSSAAHTLEQIHFRCRVRLAPPVLSPPPFSALRHVEYSLRIADSSVSWLKNTILTILAPHSSPALTVVTLLAPTLPFNSYLISSLRLEHGLMTALDDALFAHPAGRSIRWRIPRNALSIFGPWVQNEMAKVHEKGQLLVEADVIESSMLMHTGNSGCN